MIVRITLHKDELTDGSNVYAVIINGIRFECITESDAIALATKVSEAMTMHTNDTIEFW